MLVRASVIIWMSMIRIGYSQYIDYPEPLEPVLDDNQYRPWEKNETSVAWISLEEMGLQSISSSFQLHFNELPRWLVLDRNRITNLSPDAFKNLGTELTYVSLVGNQISKINTTIFNYLKKLRVLDLDENLIQVDQASGIPCDSSTLTSLYLRKCGLSGFQLPSCENDLTHLYLSGNEIRVFYTKSDALLSHLHLDSNQLMYITLSQLDWLVYLNVSNNNLKGIMKQSKGVPSRDAENFVNSFRNFFSRPRDNDKNLYLDGAMALQYLIVSHNDISEIESDTFAGTRELIHVDLSGNLISQVESGAFQSFFELQEILLDNNRITKINRGTFVDLPKLKLISLTGNRIENIEGNLFEQLMSVTNNVTLLLDNNRIENLMEGSFRGIKGLAHIGLGGNRIKTISSQAFVDLPNLQSIVIEYQLRNHSEVEAAETVNGLIESNAFYNLSNLISITIRGNSFAEIEARAFHQLPELKTLDLSNNSIHEISPRAFDDVPNIEELNLERNELLKTKPGTFPKQLKRLNLAWNLPREDFKALHVTDLHQLEELDISGTIQSFKIDDLLASPKNLTVIIGKK